MLSRASKLRLRRSLRLRKRQVGEASALGQQKLERNLFRRIERLVRVRRFVLGWMLLLALLIGSVVAQTRLLSGYYQDSVPAPGGTYHEGILGQFTNANPIYAVNLVDASVAQLVFAGLLTYDDNNHLAPELAQSWKSNELGDVFTVKLKPGLTWHDGQPLTAADVVFTFNVIKNPDARSPLQPAWRDVKVTAPDELTVKFELPNPLASFPHSLTTGIIPRHILRDVPMADMRSSEFNTLEPVGAGPFALQAVESLGLGEAGQERVGLTPFEDYQGGRPRLGAFTIRTFRTADRLVSAFEDQQIDAIAGLGAMPGQFAGDPNIRTHNMLLTAGVMSFFRNNQEILKDVNVRKALVRSIDRVSVIRSLPYPTKAVNEPILTGQLGYDPQLKQLGYNPEDARKLLAEQGWKVGNDGIRQKGGKKLSFNLRTLDNAEYKSVAEELSRQWGAVGASVEVELQDEATLQNTLADHDYDALLYGIAIGNDPDVFVYWHSSQADPRSISRLNFSEYDSGPANAALEDARTRLDPALRKAKLKPFLQVWRDDAPALGLYQPRFLYITRGEVHGLPRNEINSGAWRLIGVQNWMIREARQTPQLE